MSDIVLWFIQSLSWEILLLCMAVFFLMAIESSIFPLPSEVILIPAWVIAVHLDISLWVFIILGALGSVLGACMNYLWASIIGIPFILRFGRYVWLSQEKYHRSEQLFLKNSVLYTFLGRLIPVVRHLISLPAGVFHMEPIKFAFTTFAWAGLWSAILVLIGYYGAIYGPALMHELENYLKHIGLVILAVTGIYIFRIWYRIQFSK